MNTMNTTQKAALLMSSLSVYRGLMQRTVVKAFYELICSVDKPIREFTDAWGHFFSLLCERGCAGHWAKYLTETALYGGVRKSR